MSAQNENRQRLARLLNGVADQEGIHQTRVSRECGWPGTRSPAPVPRCIYEPMIVIIGQGCKRGYLGGEVHFKMWFFGWAVGIGNQG